MHTRPRPLERIWRRLREKQKLKRFYGLLNANSNAIRCRLALEGNTGEAL